MSTASKKTPSRKTTSKAKPGELPVGPSPSAQIDQRIAELADWRSTTLAKLRELILAADPAIVEEWKWGVPVWSRDGIVCTGETYKAVVKLTFAKGASLKDPAKLFNSSLEGNMRRALDVREGTLPEANAFKALVREAAALNGSNAKAKARPKVAK